MQHHQTLATKKGSKAVAHQSLATPLSTTSSPFIDNRPAAILQRKIQGWIAADGDLAIAPTAPATHERLQPAEPLTETSPPPLQRKEDNHIQQESPIQRTTAVLQRDWEKPAGHGGRAIWGTVNFADAALPIWSIINPWVNVHQLRTGKNRGAFYENYLPNVATGLKVLDGFKNAMASIAALVSAAAIILGVLGLAMPGAQPILTLIPIMAIAAASAHGLAILFRLILMGAVKYNLHKLGTAKDDNIRKFYRSEWWAIFNHAIRGATAGTFGGLGLAGVSGIPKVVGPSVGWGIRAIGKLSSQSGTEKHIKGTVQRAEGDKPEEMGELISLLSDLSLAEKAIGVGIDDKGDEIEELQNAPTALAEMGGNLGKVIDKTNEVETEKDKVETVDHKQIKTSHLAGNNLDKAEKEVRTAASKDPDLAADLKVEENRTDKEEGKKKGFLGRQWDKLKASFLVRAVSRMIAKIKVKITTWLFKLLGVAEPVQEMKEQIEQAKSMVPAELVEEKATAEQMKEAQAGLKGLLQSQQKEKS